MVATRFGLDAGAGRWAEVGAPASQAPRISQLQALNDVDVLLSPELIDGRLSGAKNDLLEARSRSDDLRLPPPSFRSPTGEALSRNLARAVETFGNKGGQPVATEPDRLMAESKLFSVLRALSELQGEIQSFRDQHKSA